MRALILVAAVMLSACGGSPRAEPELMTFACYKEGEPTFMVSDVYDIGMRITNGPGGTPMEHWQVRQHADRGRDSVITHVAVGESCGPL